MTEGRDVSNRRLNTVFAGWICIAMGSGIILSDHSDFAVSFAAPLSIGGILLLVVGIGMEYGVNVSSSAVASWVPELSEMPDAGRPMYRVDTTLQKPVRTSVLCGRCAHLEWVDGSKPKSYQCRGCGTELWLTEEE